MFFLLIISNRLFSSGFKQLQDHIRFKQSPINHEVFLAPDVGPCRCNRYFEDPLACRDVDTDIGLAQACYFTVHSSTVGDFKVQHSEPSGKWILKP